MFHAESHHTAKGPKPRTGYLVRNPYGSTEIGWLYTPAPRSNQNLFNIEANAILLRSEIHTLFDSRKFVVIPKRPSVDEKI